MVGSDYADGFDAFVGGSRDASPGVGKFPAYVSFWPCVGVRGAAA
jgi:hypothetical protein